MDFQLASLSLHLWFFCRSRSIYYRALPNLIYIRFQECFTWTKFQRCNNSWQPSYQNNSLYVYIATTTKSSDKMRLLTCSPLKQPVLPPLTAATTIRRLNFHLNDGNSNSSSWLLYRWRRSIDLKPSSFSRKSLAGSTIMNA